jgi:hypothetical protein
MTVVASTGVIPRCVRLEQRRAQMLQGWRTSNRHTRFPPCQVAPGQLSYWEEAEVNRQINVLVELGKMRPSNSAYACRVTLPVKKDGSR